MYWSNLFEVIQISNEEAFEVSRDLTRKEGIFAGISSGAILAAALKLAARPEFKGKTIVSIAPDFGERYLSNPVYSEI